MSKVPNVVIVICDDLGVGDVGFMQDRQTESVTPCLDRLAGESLIFTQFQSSAPVCSPTRAALLTGQYPRAFGIDHVFTAGRHRETGLPVGTPTLASALKAKGYATGLCGKWHLGYGRPHHPLDFGFDQFKGYVSGNVDYHSKVDQAGNHDWWEDGQKIQREGYVTDLVSDDAAGFIEQNAHRPFFLYVGHMAPHYPYQGPADAPLREVGQHHPDPHACAPGSTIESVYEAMLRSMDAGVGRIVAALDEAGVRDNTLLIFTSDHGATGPGSNGSQRGKKATLWQGGIRVPTFVNWPGQIDAGQDDRVAATFDLTCLIENVTGVEVGPAGREDRCDPLKEQQDERLLCWSFRGQAAARQGKWKWTCDTPDQPGQALFNLDNDPMEQHDVSGKHPDIAAELAKGWQQWSERFADVPLRC